MITLMASPPPLLHYTHSHGPGTVPMRQSTASLPTIARNNGGDTNTKTIKAVNISGKQIRGGGVGFSATAASACEKLAIIAIKFNAIFRNNSTCTTLFLHTPKHYAPHPGIFSPDDKILLPR